jgi:hypothetical protein
MDLLPAILLAIPIASILIAVRIMIVLQNRKDTKSANKPERTITIATDRKEL